MSGIEPGLDYRALSFWVLAAQAAFNVIVMVAGWISLRRKATAAEIKALADGLASLKASQALNCSQHQARTTTLEEKAKSMPTHADLGAMYERINVVKGSVDELAGLIKGMGTNVRLLVEHHLQGDKKR